MSISRSRGKGVTAEQKAARIAGVTQLLVDVAPSEVVAEYCRSTHAAWLAAPGKLGQARRDNSVRQFKAPDNRYLDRWEVLWSGGD